MLKNKNGILNGKINDVISSIGHFQKLVICDSGLPIPINAYKIDISLTSNVPSFLQVFKLIVKDMDIEKIFVASEIKENNSPLDREIIKITENQKIVINYVDHEQFKNLTSDAYCFIKTGETSAYANCIIEAGVDFSSHNNKDGTNE